MVNAALFLPDSIVIDANSLSSLSKSEDDLVRIDERISRHPLLPAIRHQLLRIEAITSVRIDGLVIDYADLARFETFVQNSQMPAEYSAGNLFRLARRSGIDHPAHVVSAALCMESIEWISRNVSSQTEVDAALLQQLFLRYNNEELARLESEGAAESLGGILNPRPMDQEINDDSGWEKVYADYLNSNRFTAIVQSELSHAMLQSIGPEPQRKDGYERAFSHLIFYRRGLLTKSVAPLAIGPLLNIEYHTQAIYTNMSGLSNPDADAGAARFTFDNVVYCTNASVAIMRLVVKALDTLERQWKERLDLDHAPQKKTVAQLINLFLEHGFLTIDFAAEELSKSFSTISSAMQLLVAAGLVREDGRINKRRVFRASSVVECFESMLNKLSSSVTMTRDEALQSIMSPAAL